jgi:hypothetical protein
MNYLYIDFECKYNSKTLSLKKMTLRNYLASTAILGGAFAENDDAPIWLTETDMRSDSVLSYLREIALSEEWTVIAHNAAFDLRVWRYLLDLPYPRHKLCSLELACAAFPCQPGGYSLNNLSRTLDLGGRKLEINLQDHTPQELETYCISDVSLCRTLAKRCLARLTPEEIKIAELCNNAREFYFHVDSARVLESVQTLSDAATSHAVAAIDLGDEDAFGWDGDVVRSVKPAAVKKALLENLGFDTASISFKKINPEKLRDNPKAATTLKAIERTNKTLSHKRRVGAFVGANVIDVELGYFRAHTGRFSSPQVGGSKGINIHNLPKRDKTLAKSIRTLFRLPPGYCFVRGDLANVEYRIEGWLTGSRHTDELFRRDRLADPYAAFWLAATGQRCSKTENVAARQLAKAAVLGLGYGMGLARWVEELLKGLADPTFGVTLHDLRSISDANRWTLPNDKYVRSVLVKSRAPEVVVAVAYHTREQFHKLHAEFFTCTRWLESTVLDAIRGLDPRAGIERAYQLATAPDRGRINLHWDSDSFGPSIRSLRVQCGVWPNPTVTWRDLCFRETSMGGYCLHCVHHAKGYRPLTKNLLIENVTQSAARNALCKGQLELENLGYKYQLSVHDEILLIVPRNERDVRDARDALLRVFGPQNTLGYDWAVLIDPNEINVSQSLYETPTDWSNLDLENLP